jgi:3D-(3,5/4)-trihydroxycyclohexane-1,2-dione acylhydrolase (decyclizing)
VIVVVGDGGYLMCPSELVTAAQEQLKITVVLVVNGGFQSIHALQRASLGRSFANEFRARSGDGTLAGPPVGVDYAASARSFGCEALVASSVADVRSALDTARAAAGPVVIVTEVEPLRGVLGGGAFWDLGVPEAAARDDVDDRAQALRARRVREQRFYG